jgi:hypothetical protein
MTQIKYDNPAKRFLRGYRALLLRRESLLREIERMRESVTGTTVQLKQDVVSTSGAGDKIRGYRGANRGRGGRAEARA